MSSNDTHKRRYRDRPWGQGTECLSRLVTKSDLYPTFVIIISRVIYVDKHRALSRPMSVPNMKTIHPEHMELSRSRHLYQRRSREMRKNRQNYDFSTSKKTELKTRSHIACNRSATSLRPKFRVVAGRLQGGCKEVGDQSPTGCRRLQGRFDRKEVLVAASETSLRPNRS